MPDARTLVLLTGFGPFPGVPVNATMRLVPELAAVAAKAFPDVRFVTDILPTAWQAAPHRLATLFIDHAPDIALHFGVSKRARGFEIERRGVNICAGADAAGEEPVGRAIDGHGPDLHQVDLPVGLIVERLRRRGIAAFLSWDAGQYLCNALLYQSLALSRAAVSGPRSAFIHIPATLELGHREGIAGAHRRRDASCPLSWPEAITGGTEIIAACLGRSPIRRPVRPPLKALARR